MSGTRDSQFACDHLAQKSKSSSWVRSTLVVAGGCQLFMLPLGSIIGFVIAHAAQATRMLVLTSASGTVVPSHPWPIV